MDILTPHIKLLQVLQSDKHNIYELVDTLQQEHKVPSKTTINSINYLKNQELIERTFSVKNGHTYRITDAGKEVLEIHS